MYRATDKLLKWETGTSVKAIPFEDATENKKQLFWAFCIYDGRMFSHEWACSNYTVHPDWNIFQPFESACDIRPLIDCMEK